MDIILTQDYPSLGYVGDRVAVRRGYARNFLIPRGIAVEVASHNARLLAHRLAGINAHKAKLKAEADELAGRLAQAKLEFTMKLGSQGKSFGAVTVRDIELALEAQGFKFERRQVRLSEPIKSAGEFEVQVKLHSEVVVSLPIKVTAEVVAAPGLVPGEQPAEGGEKPRTRRARKPKGEEGAESAKPAGKRGGEKAEGAAVEPPAAPQDS